LSFSPPGVGDCRFALVYPRPDPLEHHQSRSLGEVKTPIRDIAVVFLKLGTIAFGGPAAHIAMMEDEVVRRRRWLSHEEFLDYLGATNLIPGPNSTELAIHIGHARAGWRGLIVAGACFILPATFIVSAIAWAYVRFGALPEVSAILYGVKPVVIAVVVQALWALGRTALKTRGLMALAVLAIIAALGGVNELTIIFGAGAIMMGARIATNTDRDETRGLAALAVGSTLAQAGVPTAVASFGPWRLFAVFVKIGSVLFGSGYVLLAFLRADFVERLHWLTERQLLDAVAVGQVTPGPVFTTATFIGYILGGSSGAAIATLGIFLPAFVFVALSGILLPHMKRSPVLRAALDGVNVASLALMAVVTAQLARAAVVDWVTLGCAMVAGALLLRWRINSAWLVLLGAIVGMTTRIF
jgi:chromate transporter